MITSILYKKGRRNRYDDHHSRTQQIVEVALTNAEQTDEAVKKQLNELYAQYKGTKYTVAVFFSGKRDLHEETRSLLLFNRRRAAEKAVQAQKTVGQ